MAHKNNKKCICCSEEYRYCGRCGDYANYPTWMNIFHNENCKNIFNTTSAYLAGDITKEEAKIKFDTCDMSYKKNLKTEIIKVIDEVSKHEEKKNIEITVEVESTVSEPAENIKPEVVEETVIEEKKFFRKK